MTEQPREQIDAPMTGDELTPEPAEPLPPPGVGATGTPLAAPAPGSESTAQDAPDGVMTYVERAQEALVRVMGSTPTRVEIDPALLDRLTLLVLVRGDRCTASDVHDSWSTWAAREDPDRPGIVPFEMLDDRERQGYDNVVTAVQRAGRLMGRDGS